MESLSKSSHHPFKQNNIKHPISYHLYGSWMVRPGSNDLDSLGQQRELLQTTRLPLFLHLQRGRSSVSQLSGSFYLQQVPVLTMLRYIQYDRVETLEVTDGPAVSQLYSLVIHLRFVFLSFYFFLSFREILHWLNKDKCLRLALTFKGTMVIY